MTKINAILQVNALVGASGIGILESAALLAKYSRFFTQIHTFGFHRID